MSQNKYIVSTSKLAEIIGRTEQRVNQLSKEGVLQKLSPGKWDLVENMKIYIAFLENGRNIDDGLEIQKLQAEVDYKRQKADAAEIELAEMRGEVHRAEDVEAITADIVLTVRNALLSLPGRLAVDIAAINSAAEVSQRIKDEVVGTLNDLSRYEYDPAEYRRRVSDRRGWKQIDGDDV